uniref:Uncharacterized protein n=1 Tax=Anguilla anguilla TaxID=7936 RepID=A0A0E9PM48_ANGAN
MAAILQQSLTPHLDCYFKWLTMA